MEVIIFENENESSVVQSRPSVVYKWEKGEGWIIKKHEEVSSGGRQEHNYDFEDFTGVVYICQNSTIII